jgi:hypothetical protein
MRNQRYSGTSGSSRQANGYGPEGTTWPRRGLTGRMHPAADSMIAKIFFLAKVIHRIGIRSLHGKKSLLEILADKEYILRICGQSMDEFRVSLLVLGNK